MAWADVSPAPRRSAAAKIAGNFRYRMTVPPLVRSALARAALPVSLTNPCALGNDIKAAGARPPIVLLTTAHARADHPTPHHYCSNLIFTDLATAVHIFTSDSMRAANCSELLPTGLLDIAFMRVLKSSVALMRRTAAS